MQQIQAIFSVTFPFFALVLCGYLAAQRGVLPVIAIPGLNAFVLYFALPCMLFRFGQSTPIAQLLNIPLIAVYGFCALVIVAFCIAISLNERVGFRDAAFGALVGAFPNSGFMGLPLLVALIGASAAGPTIATMLFDMFVTSSLCLALAQLHDHKNGTGWAAFGRALRGAASNPLPWAIASGALFSSVGLSFPKPVGQFIGMLADAASPVALFTIGAVLGRSQLQQTGTSPLADYLPVALVKLLIHPLLVLLAGTGAQRLGLQLDNATLAIAVLVAALPSASNVSMLAERFGADDGRIARIIMASTVMAFFSFSAVVWLLKIKLVA